MTDETNKLMNDPNFVVQFAVGDPVPDLKEQDRNSGLRFTGKYFNQPKRYIMKSAHMSRDDVRIFDHSNGRLVYNSHHPGKNPYEAMDPLGLTNNGDRYEILGAEWESVCDVTGRGRGFANFKIRPKQLSRHGRQYVKDMNGRTMFNVGKMGKFSTMSMRPHFMVGREEDDDDVVYKIVADMMGRTLQVTNQADETVAQIAKTNKALILNAAFGAGSESTIDIAAGVDCSMMLAVVLAVNQVGKHFLGDMFNSYVLDPAQDAAVDSAVAAAGLEGVVSQYSSMSNQASHQAGSLVRNARWLRNNFFS